MCVCVCTGESGPMLLEFGAVRKSALSYCLPVGGKGRKFEDMQNNDLFSHQCKMVDCFCFWSLILIQVAGVLDKWCCIPLKKTVICTMLEYNVMWHNSNGLHAKVKTACEVVVLLWHRRTTTKRTLLSFYSGCQLSIQL